MVQSFSISCCGEKAGLKNMAESKDAHKRIPLEQVDAEFLEGNLAVLRGRFPLAAERIEKADIKGISVEPGPAGAAGVWRDDNPEPLVSKGREAENAPEVTGQFRQRLAENRARLYVLTGFGSGSVLQGLSGELPGWNTGILVLEPDAGVLRAVLSLEDWSPLLGHGKFFFAAGEDLVKQAVDILQRYHLSTVPEFCILLREAAIPEPERQRYVSWAGEILASKSALENKVNQKVTRYLKNLRRREKGSFRKVWFQEQSAEAAEYSRAQRHLALKFAGAIRASGGEVLMPRYEENTFYPPCYPVHEMMEFDPDLVIVMNMASTFGGVFGPDFSKNFPVPKACWFVDSPVSQAAMFEGCGLSDSDILFSSDSQWFKDIQSACKAVEGRPVHPLALAATYDEPGEVDEHWQCDVSYVGQVRPVPAFLRAGKTSKATRQALDFLVELLVQGRGKRPLEILEEAPELAQVRNHPEFLKFYKENILTLVWEANSRLRERTLKPLAKKSLRIYGNEDWSRRLKGQPLGKCYTGSPVRHEDLPKLYRNSRININIHHLQSSTSLNLRVFDVPAAGGFLISDAMPGIEEFFEPDREIVLYRSPEELAEKTAFYLERPEERRAIAERARQRVLKEHTFAHRWQRLQEVLRREGW
jgi:spore maturation protein CgeB